MGHISQSITHTLKTRFRADVAADYRVLDVTGELIERAMDLAELSNLRGYDAVQLAAADLINAQFVALQYPPITFVSADANLNTAAQALGLLIENPNLH